MWAYIAVFDGRRSKKSIVSSDFFNRNLQWNRRRHKFAYITKKGVYVEGIVLSMKSTPRHFLHEWNNHKLRIPTNAFRPFPDDSIQSEADMEYYANLYGSLKIKNNHLQRENQYLKQQIVELSSLLEKSHIAPTPKTEPGNNCNENSGECSH